MKKIDKFRGEFAFLSNFYFAPFEFEGEFYVTAEHCFQSSKTREPHEQRMIRRAKTPGEAKKLGRSVLLRADWEDIKLGLMERIMLVKFEQNDRLRESLLGTGNAELIEGNQFDCYWGVRDGIGENHLGKILMRVRKKLKESN